MRVVIPRRHRFALPFRLMGRGRGHARTSCATPGLEHADLLLQFLNVDDRLFEYLELELFFLSLLLVLAWLLRVAGSKLVVLIILVCTVIGRGSNPPRGIGRYEIPQHGEGVVDLGAPGLLDARMVLAAHRLARGT